MKQIIIILVFLAGLASDINGHQGKVDSKKPMRPNILIIFTDDQGYADLGCYGNSKINTPQLDQLASEGTRFTSFYAQAVCGPSRGALLTGRNPSLSKGWNMPSEEITIAELIGMAGYQTACIGKWDVSGRKAIIDQMPIAQGFDYYFGPLAANDFGTTEGVLLHENNQEAYTVYDMSVFTRLYTNKAIEYLRKRDPKKPFLLYLAHTMPHTIIDASPAFKGTSDGGLYGDVIEELDFETGRLIDALEVMGLNENTLVIFTSDNGPWNQPSYTMSQGRAGHPEGSVYWGDSGPFRAGKGSLYEGGMRVPCIVRWPGKVPANRVSDAIFSTLDFMPTFGSLAGYDLPSDRVIDGVDQTELLLGQTDDGARETFVYEHGGKMGAIRKGKWKLLLPGRKPETPHMWLRDFGTNDYELYNLESDPSEENNLVNENPEIVDELKEMADIYRRYHQ